MTAMQKHNTKESNQFRFPTVCLFWSHTHTRTFICASVKCLCVCVPGSCMKKHYMCYKHEALVTVNIRLFAFFSLNVRLLFDIDNFFFIHFNSPGYFSLRSFRKPFCFPLLSRLFALTSLLCTLLGRRMCTWTFFVSGRFGIWVVRIRNNSISLCISRAFEMKWKCVEILVFNIVLSTVSSQKRKGSTVLYFKLGIKSQPHIVVWGVFEIVHYIRDLCLYWFQ